MRVLRRVFRIPDRRDAIHEDVDAELAFHLEMRAAKLRAAGLDPSLAHSRARERFGDLDAIRDACLEVEHRQFRRRRRMTFIDDIRRDLWYALRGARRARGFTTTAIFTMALGIGATTAVFSVVDAVFIRPPSYPDPDRLVRVFGAAGQNGSWQSPFSTPNFDDLRTRARTLSAIGGSVWNEATVTGLAEPERVMTAAVYGDFFGAMGTRPLIGRVLRPEEAVTNGPAVAVVSYEFWKDRLGGGALDGKRVTLRGRTYDVVGVMPAGFTYPSRAKIWIGSFYTGAGLTGRNGFLWSTVARLAPGATLAQARTEVDGIAKALHATFGDEAGITGAYVIPFGDVVVGQLKRPVAILGAAVALVLLIACVNLASAILARTEARRQELTVRAALGAARARLVRQLLAETVLLTAVGGVLGCGVAVVLTRLLVALGPSATGLSSSIDVHVHAPMLVAAIALAAVCGVLIGLLPALRASRVDLRGELAAGGRSMPADGARLRRPLVIAEVALALTLAVGATLLIRSLRTLMGGSPGFDPTNVVTLDLSLPESRYADGVHVVQFFDRFLTETAHVPGVEAVGIVNSIPFGPGQVGGGIVTDDAPDLKGHGAYYRLVNDGYFAALRIPVLRGRVFDRRDRLGSTPVAVVTQSFANAYWPGKNPIGHRIRWVPQFDAHDDWLEVVGVVGNTKEFAQDDASGPAVYVSYAQRPERALEGVTAVVRAHSVDAPMLTAIRDVVRDIDHDVPTTSISTLTRVISQSVANRRFTMSVMIGFGAFAMFLAALGLYSVLAYGVTRRSREIGVRIALGATPRGVLFAIVRDGMTAVSVGVIIGVASALALTRLMQSMLYGVAPTDAASFGLAIAALLAVGAAACALPARRAALIDPADAMRSD